MKPLIRVRIDAPIRSFSTRSQSNFPRGHQFIKFGTNPGSFIPKTKSTHPPIFQRQHTFLNLSFEDSNKFEDPRSNSLTHNVFLRYARTYVYAVVSPINQCESMQISRSDLIGYFTVQNNIFSGAYLPLTTAIRRRPVIHTSAPDTTVPNHAPLLRDLFVVALCEQQVGSTRAVIHSRGRPLENGRINIYTAWRIPPKPAARISERPPG